MWRAARRRVAAAQRVRGCCRCVPRLTALAAQATVLQVAGLTDASSTAARAALATGGDGAGALHPDVLAYARAHALYAP